jgi:hypothetical protein
MALTAVGAGVKSPSNHGAFSELSPVRSSRDRQGEDHEKATAARNRSTAERRPGRQLGTDDPHWRPQRLIPAQGVRDRTPPPIPELSRPPPLPPPPTDCASAGQLRSHAMGQYAFPRPSPPCPSCWPPACAPPWPLRDCPRHSQRCGIQHSGPPPSRHPDLDQAHSDPWSDDRPRQREGPLSVGKTAQCSLPAPTLWNRKVAPPSADVGSPQTPVSRLPKPSVQFQRGRVDCT